MQTHSNVKREERTMWLTTRGNKHIIAVSAEAYFVLYLLNLPVIYFTMLPLSSPGVGKLYSRSERLSVANVSPGSISGKTTKSVE
jgi:hypothetical protein